MNPTGGVLLFTAIEVVTMIVWLALALHGYPVMAVVVLIVGLFFEHLVAYNVGAGARFFHFPPERPK